jgi:uncharacterized membrane protein
MPTARNSTEVAVPIDTAYNQWTQFETFPEFMEGVKSVTQLSDTMTHWEFSLDGVAREFDAEITEQVPDSHIAWRAMGELNQGGRVEFEDLGDDRTKVTLTVDWEPEGVAEKVGAFLMADDALILANLLKFKQFIESRGVEEDGWRGRVRDGETMADGHGSPRM